MHYICEVIMPPTDDIEAALESVLEPFNEQGKDEDGEDNRYAFWDWWVIGGRYSGLKLMDSLDKTKLAEFEAWLKDEKVTVSGIQFGKQEISPADQIPKIDAKWNEMFPSPDGELFPCPLFRHAGDRLRGDILPLSQAKAAKASRVIIAAPSWNNGTYDGPLEAKFMLAKEIYNGVTWQDAEWDSTIQSALEQHLKAVSYGKEEYQKAVTPTDDWLVVTVDYHT